MAIVVGSVQVMVPLPSDTGRKPAAWFPSTILMEPSTCNSSPGAVVPIPTLPVRDFTVKAGK